MSCWLMLNSTRQERSGSTSCKMRLPSYHPNGPNRREAQAASESSKAKPSTECTLRSLLIRMKAGNQHQ